MEDIIKTSNIESILQVCTRLDLLYPNTGEDPCMVLWRALIADTFGGDPVPLTLLPSFKAWVRNQLANRLNAKILDVDQEDLIIKLHELLPEIHRRSNCESSMPTEEDVVQTMRLMNSYSPRDSALGGAVLDPDDPFLQLEKEIQMMRASEMDFANTLGHTAQSRRIFRTEKGYLGLGPASVQGGEEVWLFQGATVPFILRGRIDEAYTLMGESYVHGCMDEHLAEVLYDQMAQVCIA